jgi:uncharacterized protein (DUF849 family)
VADDDGDRTKRPLYERTAAMTDAPDVVDLLTEDHRRLERLLERLDQEQDPTELRSIHRQILDELAAHERCEQEIVFPALRAGLPAAIRSLRGQHEEVNSLLFEMCGVEPTSFAFVKRASALGCELRAHFAEEEDLFTHLRTVLDPADLVDLSRRARTAKASPLQA